MLKFADRRAQALYMTGKAKGIPDIVAPRAMFVMDLLDKAATLQDIRFFRSLRLTKVKGSRPTRLMVHIADGYWLSFRWRKNACIEAKIERFRS